MDRRKKPINNSDIPQHAIETIARCLLPDILAYYKSEEGQQEFQEDKSYAQYLLFFNRSLQNWRAK